MTMQLVFSDQTLPNKIVKSLFLGGPSPRKKDTNNWRHDALTILESLNYTGTVLIPIPQHLFYNDVEENKEWNYDDQIDWECQARQMADHIIYWVPRDIEKGLPGFTTNFEIGEDLNSGKSTYGRPNYAEKCKYIDKRYVKKGMPVYLTLESLLKDAVNKLGEGALRIDGETYIPLFIWNTKQFQTWYTQQKTNGNSLKEAEVRFHSKMKDQSLYSFVLWVNIWIHQENRFKSNEFLFSRKHISVVLPYYEENNSIKVILIKEFRSSVNNKMAYVYDLPGGSSDDEFADEKLTAQEELHEEAGLLVEDLNRFVFIGKRQLMATIAPHLASVYKLKLTKEEFKIMKNMENTSKILGIDDEKTYIQIIDTKDIKQYPLDYSVLGIIYEGLY
jgi:hypothetical protein